MAPHCAQGHEPNPPSAFLFDALCCSEQQWDLHLEEGGGLEECRHSDDDFDESPLTVLEQDLFWYDQELVFLTEKESANPLHESLGVDPTLGGARVEAVEWILEAQTHHGFSVLTAVLAVNCLDRVLSRFRLLADKPWTGQLAALACLSLAAKMEETRVPLLLDLQVEGTSFLFEAKTVQRMELLVLSALEWKMNPVTPVSFLNYFARRLRLKANLHWEFLRRSELILLSMISDGRSVSYLPSVIATAIMLHVVNSGDPSLELDYQRLLLDMLHIQKDQIDGCRKLISEHASQICRLRKRKLRSGSVPGSPKAVLEMCFSPRISNDSQLLTDSESKNTRAEAES
ncbi:hypothetical protein SAY87_003979 [Trapa incisa]|uniref:Uncharacterized protein n=1 Tax=Trapa incisa TaxID=236973 RepID=A0AAN7PJA9_9MYRT|nr:hypothetical protein SAY87_003979 [Trapa incisa]